METGNNLYLNYPQAISELTRFKHSRFILGRGLGKTTGIVAPRLINLQQMMPRTTVGLIARSYVQILTRILPAVVKGWNERGFIEGRHWFIGEYAPKSYGWDMPFKPAMRKQYIIHTCFGGCIALISQDRPGSANGLDLSALVGDEAKFLHKGRMDEEVIPAMRGERHLYGHLPEYRSTLFTTDMPTSYDQEWLINGPDNMDLALSVARAQAYVNMQLAKCANRTDDSVKHVLHDMRSNQIMIDEIRKRTTMTMFASSLQNINVLGPDYFEDLLDILDIDDFRVSVLNQKVRRSKQMFYSDLSENIHGYFPQVSSFLSQHEFDFRQTEHRDFRMDEEFDSPHGIIHIGYDSGARFNCMVVANYNRDSRSLSVINAIGVRHPMKIRDCVMQFKRYYQYHSRKECYVYYDQTQVGENSLNETTIAETVIKALEDGEHGAWRVHRGYVRQSPTHETRHQLWSNVLQGKDEDISMFKYNVLNAANWYDSAVAASVIKEVGRLKKDKSSERKNHKGGYDVPPEKATHFSEAADILLYGIKLFKPQNTISFEPSL